MLLRVSILYTGLIFMNSFQRPINQFCFDEYKPEDAVPALKAHIAEAKERLEAILSIAKQDRDYANTVQAHSDMSDEAGYVYGVVSHLESVLGEPWSSVDLECTKLISEFYTELSADKRIYDMLQAVATQNKENHTAAQKRYLKDLLESYERGGILLPQVDRDEIKKINQRLSELSTIYSQNVTKKNDDARLYLENVEDLDGLTKDIIKDAAKQAKDDGRKGYALVFNQPLSIEVLSKANIKTTRDAYSKMVNERNDGVNEPIASEILKLRHQLAIKLGFKDYADLNTANKMAKTGDIALQFIQDMRKLYQEGAAKEYADLERFIQEYEQDDQATVPSYEVFSSGAYYANLFKKSLFDVEEDDVKPYLPINQVLSGMFEALSKLYGVSFKENKVQQKWHHDVKVYDIFDVKERHIAVVWCDWFARPGKKPGAWMNQLYVANRAGGNYDQPHQGLVCGNMPKPTKSSPALLNMRDVETIWHEFGHFMHLAFSSTELKEQSMMATKWDFVEAPSQIMENFVWEDEVLAMMGKHHATGDPIPKDLIAKLKQARNFRVCSGTIRQSILSEADLRLHRELHTTDITVTDFYQKVSTDISPAKEPSDSQLIHVFGHIFAGGYAAGYYSYKWAESIEADMYTRFANAPEVLDPSIGAQYRDKVLARGDEYDPDVLVRDFLGRDSNQNALLLRDGLALKT